MDDGENEQQQKRKTKENGNIYFSLCHNGGSSLLIIFIVSFFGRYLFIIHCLLFIIFQLMRFNCLVEMKSYKL